MIFPLVTIVVFTETHLQVQMTLAVEPSYFLLLGREHSWRNTLGISGKVDFPAGIRVFGEIHQVFVGKVGT